MMPRQIMKLRRFEKLTVRDTICRESGDGLGVFFGSCFWFHWFQWKLKYCNGGQKSDKMHRKCMYIHIVHAMHTYPDGYLHLSFPVLPPQKEETEVQATHSWQIQRVVLETPMEISVGYHTSKESPGHWDGDMVRSGRTSTRCFFQFGFGRRWPFAEVYVIWSQSDFGMWLHNFF